jgi:hypothetical protein
MGRPVRADNSNAGRCMFTREGPGLDIMDSSHTRTCPSCGAVVVLPAYCRLAEDGADIERISKLTRAVCGCWVDQLPEEVTLRLVKAVASESKECGPCRLGALKAGT